jgi:threonine aldolase
MQFASDNTAAVAPAILEAIGQANVGFARGYGDDALTEQLMMRFASVFEHEVACFLVSTGTAANALAVAHLAPPWGAVLCHEESHLVTDECGAPEFFGGGLKLVGLGGEGGKLAPERVVAALAGEGWGGPHHVTPSVLSLTQATEAGTLYRGEEIRQLSDIAHRRGMKVHIDGARFANALARLGCTPAQATWKIGVDAISLGATKAGALAAEAVVLFDPGAALGMMERRKRAGHLLSKHRFLAAQFAAFLADDLWLNLARHANAMADGLAAGLTRAGLHPVWPVEANEVFVVLPRWLDRHLREAGASYYAWSSSSLPAHVTIGPHDVLVRLVTSFATTREEVERFAAAIQT